MSRTTENDPEALAKLRARIDAVDEEMHRLLMARGEVIDTLIRIKGTSRPGAAFRPGREADMMRRLVARHHGVLPLATAEHIWREIITTFTRIQASFDVAMDISVAADRMRDLARFYFGFAVDLLPLDGPIAVVAHVAETNDLGLIALGAPSDGEAWWRALGARTAPRIIALLPFIRAAGRPADLPAFVVSPPISDATSPDVRLYAVAVKGEARPSDDVAVLAEVSVKGGSDALIAAPADMAQAKVIHALGGKAGDLVEVGGVPRGIALDGEETVLHARAGVKEAIP